MNDPRFPELGFSTLAGGAQNPRDHVDECRRADELGFEGTSCSARNVASSSSVSTR